jgi:hypothetical protein
MRVLVVISFLLIGCAEAMACPGCSYERMAVWYPTVVCIRLAVVPFLVVNRLDFVRVLGVFVGYEVFWYYAYRYALWFAHPAVGDGFVQAAAEFVFFLLHTGVLGAGLLFLLGRLRYFRGTSDRGLPWWQALIYMPLAIVIQASV